ncbi:MAG: YwaF family protein [Clostridia bacterium]|nr:YwaF family protein [Clostridia bacterium]
MHQIFEAKHLIIIAISLTLIVGLFFLSRKTTFDNLCKIMFYVGIVSETVKIFTYIIINEDTHGGILPKTDLPFHLCSIQILFVAVLNFSKNEKLKRFLLSFMFPSCLIGGLAAIFIATSSSLNNWVITFQYFLYHVAIIVLALNICTRKEIKLGLSDYFNSLKFVGILLFFSIYVNSIVYDGVSNINFMYVASPPVSGLPFLNEDHGWFVYIIHYACLILFALTMCYIKPIVFAIKAKLAANKSVSPATPTLETAAADGEAEADQLTENENNVK